MRVSKSWVAAGLVPATGGLVVLVLCGGGAPGSSPATPRAVRIVRAAARRPPPRVSSPLVPREEPSRAGAHPAPVAAAAPATSSRVEGVLASIRSAHDREDEAGLARARARLDELVAADPRAALEELLSLLRRSTDETELGLAIAILAHDERFPQGEVLAALAALAESDELPLRRAAAVRALGDLPGGDEARVGRVAALVGRDPDPEVRESGAIALGALGDRSPGPLAASAARATVEALATEREPRVRATLLYALRDTRDGAVADAVLAALSDPDASVRVAAADVLGDVAAAHRARAVESLAARFERETGRDLRVTILGAIVRAGRLAAIPALERLHAGDLATMVEDDLAGLRSGEDNPDKLFALRLARERARGER